MKLYLPQGPFRWAARSFQERGVIQTTMVVWSYLVDLAFDWKYGTDTIRRVEMNTLMIKSANKDGAQKYGATKAQPFMRLMRGMDLPTDSVFVDIGSGKGKVLLMAAQYGFERIKGIDFSSELCAIARANIAAYQKKHPLHSDIDIIECDATAYRFCPEEAIFFMSDPFNGLILGQVLGGIRLSLEEAPRRIWFIYHCPEHHNVVMESHLFQGYKDFNITGSEFRVYTNDKS